MSQAAFTRELRRRLREDGEATILLADMADPPHRGYLDTDDVYRERLIARARQRLYWAGFYERVNVSTLALGRPVDRVLGTVEGERRFS